MKFSLTSTAIVGCAVYLLARFMPFEVGEKLAPTDVHYHYVDDAISDTTYTYNIESDFWNE